MVRNISSSFTRFIVLSFISCIPIIAMTACNSLESDLPDLCAGTTCEITCAQGLVAWAEQCIDPLNDPTNCGGCIFDEGENAGVSCAPDELCHNGTCQLAESVVCDSSEPAKCTSNGDSPAVVTCIEGRSVILPCPEDATCEDGMCSKPAVCGNGKLEVGEICDGEHFIEGTKVCPKGTKGDAEKITCDESTCKPDTSHCQAQTTECNVIDQKRCFNNKIEVCDENLQWQEEETCDELSFCRQTLDNKFLCSCTPNQRKCLADSKLSICGDDLVWQEAVACPDGKPCNTEANDCTCEKDTSICVNEDQQALHYTCNANSRWEKPVICPAGCNNTMTDCKTAESCDTTQEGTTRCKDNSMETCQKQLWITTSACESGLCMNNEKCLPQKCKEIFKVCIGNDHYKCESVDEQVDFTKTICGNEKTCNAENGCV